jgi:acetoin:2,6-dichlorophenolindophenol oxidoreductase subunit alpha
MEGEIELSPEKKQLIDLYTKMLSIRRFEERVAEEFRAGNIKGYIHSYIGEEAVASGVCANMTNADRICSNHRGHGHCIAKGAGMNRMMAEIFGKKTGYCKGKGGSMHIADFSVGMLGADGIVGAGLPIASGAAIAAQLENNGAVAAVFFGDGACQEGEFHEVLNLASIWKLPLLFVCENNLYGVHNHQELMLGAKEIVRMPRAYHIPSEVVDGNDVIAVYEAAKAAIDDMRKGGGPHFLECKTYRWHKHFLSEWAPDRRPPAEVETWKKRCPIDTFEKKMLKDGIITESEFTSIKNNIKAMVEEAIKFAYDSPYPLPEDALEDVYSV